MSRGKVDLIYPANTFPRPIHFLNDLAEGRGDSTAAGHGAVFVLAAGKPVKVLGSSDTARATSSADGIFRAGGDTLYVVGYHTGALAMTDGHGAWQGGR